MTPLTSYGYGSSKETGENHEKKGVGTDNPCKSRKPSQIEQLQDICFFIIFDRYFQKFSSGGETGD